MGTIGGTTMQQGQPDARPEITAKLLGRERRADTRHCVDCQVLVVPMTGATQVPGHLVDISAGGCRLETKARVMVTIMMRVELQFQLRGIAFRLVGVCQGTRGGNFYAVRFQDVSQRKRIELMEVIDEVMQANARKAVAAADFQAVEQGRVTDAGSVNPGVSAIDATRVAIPAVTPVLSTPPLQAPVVAVAPSLETSLPVAVANSGAFGVGCRVNSRHIVDTSAQLLLIKAGISMPSRILNLSLSGCRLRTEEPFNVGIYVRLEAEFCLNGLAFRLGGVSQAILDKHTIGIRFLDVSERRREQLVELIAEIADAEAAKAVADGGEEAAV